MEEKREKRITSFFEKEKESAKMKIPPLNHTFGSVSFINPEVIWSKAMEILIEADKAFGSLSIDMVEVGDQEIGNTRLPLFPRGQALDNWTTIELFVVFKISNE